MNDRLLCVLLTCFDTRDGAGKARRPMEGQVASSGGRVLETVIARIGATGRPLVHDPHRDLAGGLTAALTWGVFGAVTGSGIAGVIVSAVLGAILGGLGAYLAEHVLSKDQLHQIASVVPTNSSALLQFLAVDGIDLTLAAAGRCEPSAASAAGIDADLNARVLTRGSSSAIGTATADQDGEASRAGEATTALSMILVQYPDPHAATNAAARLPSGSSQVPVTVELLIAPNRHGRLRVTDPTNGVSAMARSDLISWGGMGLVLGAIAGLTGQSGILGFLGSGLITGIGWGLFGLIAGALYGLWAGRAISASRLSRLDPILEPGGSSLVAWAAGRVTPADLEVLTAPGAQHLVLGFRPVPGGAILVV